MRQPIGYEGGIQMPRIRQYAENYAAEDFRREMRSRMGYHDLSQSDLAGMTNISQSTISNRIRDPNCITVGELRSINKAIGLNAAVVLALLGYSKKQIKEESQ